MINSHLVPKDVYEDRIGQNIAARLSSAADHLPHDISERLKVARMQALAKRKITKLQTASAVSTQGEVAALHIGGDHRSLWIRIASLIPLLALVAGLFSIALIAEERLADEIAEVDAELLTDELPPDAYTDPGFAQFLRINHRD